MFDRILRYSSYFAAIFALFRLFFASFVAGFAFAGSGEFVGLDCLLHARQNRSLPHINLAIQLTIRILKTLRQSVVFGCAGGDFVFVYVEYLTV